MHKRILTEEAQKRAEEFEDEYYEEPTDSKGWTREKYNDLGMKVPQELIDKEKELSKGLEFNDEDYEDFYSECAIKPSQIIMTIEDADGGTTIYLKNGIYVSVEEDVDEVQAQMWRVNRSWWEKAVSAVKNK